MTPGTRTDPATRAGPGQSMTMTTTPKRNVDGPVDGHGTRIATGATTTNSRKAFGRADGGRARSRGMTIEDDADDRPRPRGRRARAPARSDYVDEYPEEPLPRRRRAQPSASSETMNGLDDEPRTGRTRMESELSAYDEEAAADEPRGRSSADAVHCAGRATQRQRR